VPKHSQDECASIGYSESCGQEPRRRTLFGHLPFDYFILARIREPLNPFSVPLHLEPQYLLVLGGFKVSGMAQGLRQPVMLHHLNPDVRLFLVGNIAQQKASTNEAAQLTECLVEAVLGSSSRCRSSTVTRRTNTSLKKSPPAHNRDAQPSDLDQLE
jgi:hypothetical protein